MAGHVRISRLASAPTAGKRYVCTDGTAFVQDEAARALQYQWALNLREAFTITGMDVPSIQVLIDAAMADPDKFIEALTEPEFV